MKARLGYSICSKLVSYDHTPLLETNRDCNNLWDFILEEQSNNDSSAKAFDLYTKGGKRIIKAKNKE